MKELIYFDCNARFGPRPKKHKRERWTNEQLLKDLELTGIAGALAVYEQSLLHDAMHSSRVLIDEIRGDCDALYSCWAAMPPWCGDLRDNDVRATRIAPAIFNIPAYGRAKELGLGAS